MNERTGIVTLGGNPVTLVGNEVKVGDKAPDFTSVGNDMSPLGLSSFDGKVRVILSVASLDTGICDTETRRFNEEAAKLGDDVRVMVLSMDLPFAQKRWCGAAGVDRVVTLSDHRDASFGPASGVLLKEARPLAGAVFVVDREGIVRYVEQLAEVGTEPDYEAALNAARQA